MYSLETAGYEILSRVTPDNLIQRIELGARTCYKSEDHIKEKSAEKLLSKTILPRKHYSVLEHGTLTVLVSEDIYKSIEKIKPKLIEDWEDKLESDPDKIWTQGSFFLQMSNELGQPLITGNVRAFNRLYEEYSDIEEVKVLQTLLHDTNDIVFKIEESDKRLYTRFEIKLIDPSSISSTHVRLLHQCVSVKLTVDRGITHELVRHRFKVSFSQESTRYVVYTKKGFVFIDPRPAYKYSVAMNKLSEDERNQVFEAWLEGIQNSITAYDNMKKVGAPAEFCRGVLPNAIKADIVMTAPIICWYDIFRQRTAPAAHPQMREVMFPLAKEFEELVGVKKD